MSGRNGTVKALTGTPRTAGYRMPAVNLPAWAGLGGITGSGFTLRSVDEMRRDPAVSMCLAYKVSPLFSAEVEIQCQDPGLTAYLQKQIDTFWHGRSLAIALECYPWGYSGAEALYRQEDDGALHFDGLQPLHAFDVRPWTSDGVLRHVRVLRVAKEAGKGDGKPVDLEAAEDNRPGKGVWFVREPHRQQWYGVPILAPAWLYWRLKTMPDGMVEIVFKWLYKHSYSGMVVRYPHGQQYSDDSGTQPVQSQDLARQMADSAKAGANFELPSDRDGNGNFLWVIEQYGKIEGNADGLIKVLDEYLDKQIQRALEIPDEVITHQGSTGGYSRSQVAAATFFLDAERSGNEVLDRADAQIFRPLVWFNYGRQASQSYKLKLKPLLAPDQPQGGMPGMPAPGGGGGDPLAALLQPYQGPRGGSGMVDPNTGKVKYGLSLADADQGGYRLSQVYDPEAQCWRLAWVYDEGPRGGKRWRNTDTGKVRYAKEKPGAIRERIAAKTERSTHEGVSGLLGTGGAVELHAHQKEQARRALAALRKHHGERTLDRVEELARKDLADLAATTHEGRRDTLLRRLQAYRMMLGELGTPAAVEAPPKKVSEKEPWEMTRKEWNEEFDRDTPSSSGEHRVSAASRIGKSVRGAEDSFRQLQEKQDRLKMNLPDIDSDTGLPWKDSPREGLQIPARHRQVIEHALAAGKPVPPEVLADYPDLQAKLAPAETPPAVQQGGEAFFERQQQDGALTPTDEQVGSAKKLFAALRKGTYRPAEAVSQATNDLDAARTAVVESHDEQQKVQRELERVQRVFASGVAKDDSALKKAGDRSVKAMGAVESAMRKYREAAAWHAAVIARHPDLAETPPAVQPGFEHVNSPDVVQAKDHPRERDYDASQLESGLWVTPYTRGTYSTKRDAMTEARKALNDYAERKPAKPKPERHNAAELRREANEAAKEQTSLGKQIDEMTQAEFLKKQGALYGGGERAIAAHRRVIEAAVAAGKFVPPEVLKDYPDIKPYDHTSDPEVVQARQHLDASEKALNVALHTPRGDDDAPAEAQAEIAREGYQRAVTAAKARRVAELAEQEGQSALTSSQRSAHLAEIGFVVNTGRANPETEEAVMRMVGTDDMAEVPRKLKAATDDVLRQVHQVVANDPGAPATMRPKPSGASASVPAVTPVQRSAAELAQEREEEFARKRQTFREGVGEEIRKSSTPGLDSAPASNTIGAAAATGSAGSQRGKTMEPLKRREGESALEFLRRFAADPGAAESWTDVSVAANDLPRNDVSEAETVLGMDAPKRDSMYPTTHIWKEARRRYEEATAHRGREERAAKARELLAMAETTDDPKAVEDQWRQLTDTTRGVTSLQLKVLAEDLGVEPDAVGANLRGHMQEKLRPAHDRQKVSRARKRVEALYAKPKDFGLTKRDLPKTPPPGAMVTTPDVRQVRGGGFPGNKKGDVVTVFGEPHVVLAASGVAQIRDPELGLLGRRQHILTRPATADEADAHLAAGAKERWRTRTIPFDDYNLGGYQTEAQRAEAEEWLRRYEQDPVAAYRAEKAGEGVRS